MKQLRGAPISVLFVLVLKNSMTSNNDLCDLTGYKKNSVVKALSTLESLDLVQKLRRYGGWLATNKTKQLMLIDHNPVLLESNNEMIKSNLHELEIQGIPKTELTLEIARTDGITPSYIYKQSKRLRSENKFSTGLLIRVLQDQDPVENTRQINKQKYL